jgi:tetratricopeptide (TPR) repeat protein
MLTPDPMPTIRIQVGKSLMLFLAAVTFFAGCTPAGPKALLQGKNLLERGRYTEAVEKLRLAAQLLGMTNAQAYNYLGVACHHAGYTVEAEKAYQRALALNPDLAEARYNLGCLWLEQNKLEPAKSELTAYTLRRANSLEGWLKLGAAQLRSSDSAPTYARAADLAAAERSFNTALLLNPHSAQALADCGLAKVRRGHPEEAAQLLQKSLAQQPDYGPALLNLAIVQQQYLNERTAALEKYRKYLALKPQPGNAEAVRAIAGQLEQELTSAPHLPPSGPSPGPTNALAAATPTPEPARSSVIPRPLTNDTRVAAVSKPRVPTNPPPIPVPANPKPASAPPATPTNMETETLGAEPVLKIAQDSATTGLPVHATSGSDASNPTQSFAKRSLLQHVHSAGLSSNDSKSASIVTSSTNTAAESQVPAEPAPTPSRRYAYRSPAKLTRGNRADAERSFAQGVQAQQAQHLNEAIQAYRQAAQLDPSYFDAYYNLGRAGSEAGNLGLALSSYESALAVKPDSLDARYNFALALKQGNYFLDAVHELEQLLKREPNDSRAHLALGNLYAQQFQEPANARPHYLKVLQNDPRNPQAGAIRYWLTDNPP